jgi:hypothetical protein
MQWGRQKARAQSARIDVARARCVLNKLGSRRKSQMIAKKLKSAILNLRQAGGLRPVQAVVGVVTLSLVLLLAFQNCAEPLELSETDASTYSDNLPFAFDVKVDTFAYMSCNTESQEFEPRAIFNFRIGAYEPTSGIKLTEEFKKATASFSAQAKTEALFRSPTNSGSILQLAIRNSSSDYQQILLNSTGSIQLGKDLDNYLSNTPLDAPGISSKLVELKGDERVQYFRGTPGLEGRFLEQSLRFNQVLKSATDKMSGSTGSRVVMSYTADNNPLNYFARGPKKNELSRNIYGLEFRTTFAGPQRITTGTPMNTATDRNRILNSLGVIDITKKNVQAETMWTCPPEYRYMVVRPEDANKLLPGRTDPAILDNLVCEVTNWTYDNPPVGRENELEILRRVIRIEDYYVNMARRCIVAKDRGRGVCYPTNAPAMNINYDATACNDDPANKVYQCPNFVSICVAPAG